MDNQDVWEASTRGPLLKAHASAIGVSTKALLADLRRWWLGGQTIDALLGNFYRVGRVNESNPGALSVQKETPTGKATVVFGRTRGRAPLLTRRGAN